MVSDEKSQASDCGSGNTCGVPRLENRETWGTHGFYSAEVNGRGAVLPTRCGPMSTEPDSF